MNAINSSANGQARIAPTFGYRAFSALGILGTRDLCCQSKTRFILGTFISTFLAILFGLSVCNEMVAYWLAISAFIAPIVCLALGLITPLPYSGTPIELGPSIYRPSMQCTLHLKARRVRRCDAVSALCDAVAYLEDIGMKNALLESRLISRKELRSKIVDRLNGEFTQRGYCWRAIDKGESAKPIQHLIYRFWFGIERADQESQSASSTHKNTKEGNEWGGILIERNLSRLRVQGRNNWRQLVCPFRAHPHVY